jgi:hypothetical protein
MLNIRVDDVPAKSKKFRIFEGEYGKSPFVMSGIIEPDDNGGCEITNVQGDMSNEANELMATTVRDMGYLYLTFKVLKGTKVTRYAIKEKSDDNFDYYLVPLRGQKTQSGK